MDWNDLRIFLAIARSASLGAAGRSLGLSHPTMARRLKALEDALGEKLLQRTADGFALTQEGASIIALAEQVEDATLAMERRLAGGEGGLQGTLRVTASDWFGSWMLPPVVEAFSKRHPDVTVELLTGSPLYSLGHREADLAFRVVPFEESDVLQRRLLTLRFGAYAASGYPIEPEGTGAGLHIIEDARTEAFPDVGWLKSRFVDAKVVLRSNNRAVQARMAAEGVGLALLPRPLGDRMPGLRLIDLGVEPPGRNVWLGYHRDLRNLRRLRAFVDVSTECLGPATGGT